MNPGRNKAAFSLIELLVVVAVIAILASLLLPAISRAKAEGHLAKCKSNQRQILAAITMYAQDTGAFPYWRWLDVRLSMAPAAWFQQLSPYMGNSKWGGGVYKCPAYKWDVNLPYETYGATFGGADSYGYSACAGSYSYNAFGNGPSSPFLNGGLSSFPNQSPVQETMVRNPAGLYAIGDSVVVTYVSGDRGTNNYGGPDVYWGDWAYTNTQTRIKFITQHPSGYNMGFVDTHVELVKADKLYSRDAKYARNWNRFGWAPGEPYPF